MVAQQCTVCLSERKSFFFYESEESEMKRGRGLLRWSVVKGIDFFRMSRI